MLWAALVAVVIVSAQDIEVARPAVESWLKLIDTQQYASSWDSAAAGFKAAIAQDKWTGAVAGARAGVGQLKSRTLKSATHKTAVPGAPAGEYVIFQFDAVFEKNPSATELVTVVKETDGSWRVAGYVIR